MSMSQEEIEALMSGLDIEEDTSSPDEVVENVKVNTQEIEGDANFTWNGEYSIITGRVCYSFTEDFYFCSIPVILLSFYMCILE